MSSREFDLDDLLTQEAWIHDLARRLVADESAAEDVAQDAWVSALEKPPQKPGPIRSWLRRVVRNRVFMTHRGEVHRRERERAAARPEKVPSVAEIQEREEARIRVTRSVFSLEEPYRAAILYRYFENLPPREIAAQLGISSRAVEERLRRGLEKLRARLDRDFGDRRSWCAALLPLIGVRGPAVAATTSGGAASASVLAGAGALVMSMKIKIGIAVLVALAAAYALWPRDEAVPPPEIDQAEVSRPAAPERTREAKIAEQPAGAKIAEPAAKPPDPGRRPAPVSQELARSAIVGQVTEADGTPIGGATVRALRYGAGDLELKPFLSTRTDARGGYVLKPVRERCVVEASADAHYSTRRLVAPFSRQNFALGEPGRLRGRIRVAADRSACADASVAVYRFRPDDVMSEFVRQYFWQRPPVAAVRTDATGRYAIANLRPGRYHLRVVPAEGPQVSSPEHAVDILAGRETVKDLAVSRGFDIVGRATERETGRPVAGVEVFLRVNPRKRAVTGEDGRYVLKAVGMNELRMVSARARGFMPSVGMPPRPANFGRKVEYDIRLMQGAVARGRVLGPDGAPVAGARVGASRGIFMLAEERMTRVGERPFVTTGDDGAFEVTLYASRGQGRVYAIKEGLAWGASKPFVVAAGEEKTGIVVRLERGAAVGGRITDESGRAVGSAQVTLLQGQVYHGQTSYSTRRTTFSRADGRYEIVGVPPGTYRLEVVPPGLVSDGHSPYSGAVREGLVFAEGNRFAADVTLKTGATISGRVVDASGRAVEGAALLAMPADSRGHVEYRLTPTAPRAAASNADGRFTIQGLDAGVTSYGLRVRKAGYDLGYVKDLAPGRAGVVIALRGVRSVQGQVTIAATGRPAAEFKLRGIMVAGPGGAPKPERVYSRPRGHFADLEGRFTLALVPGRYTIEAQTPEGQRSDTVTVEIPEIGTAGPIHLAVKEGAALVGRVLGADGEPVKDVGLRLWRVGDARPRFQGQARTDSAGSFEYRSLESGTFVLYGEGRWRGRTRAVSRRLELRAGAPREIALRLQPGVEVVVAVAERGRGPVAGAKVAVRRTDGVPVALDLSRSVKESEWFRARVAAGNYPSSKEMWSIREESARRLAITDGDGKLPGLLLVPGEYAIHATATGHAPARKTVKIAAGGKRTVEIVLEKQP